MNEINKMITKLYWTV